ncbi:hypothetical protein FB45DRAFT_756082, partial [Roridomyces roridus]
LPDDVVREIFIAWAPSKENTTLRASDAPMLLCHITCHWRNLAFSTQRCNSSYNQPGGFQRQHQGTEDR